MHQLLRFNNDIHVRDAVKAYMVSYFEEQIVKEARAGKSVEALAEAVNKLEGAFNQLSIDLDVKPEQAEQTNQAR